MRFGVLSLWICLAANVCTAEVVVDLTFENGQTPESQGFVAFSNTSGTHANSSFNIPQLGDRVWELSANSFFAGYNKDMAGIMSDDDGFEISGYFRQIEGSSGNMTRTRAAGSFSGRPSGFVTSDGQWYFLELSRDPGEETFTRSIFEVSHSDGSLTLRRSETETGRFMPSQGSLQDLNAVEFGGQNAGAPRIRTQFDNFRVVRIAVPEPSSLGVLIFAVGLTMSRRSRR